MFKHFAAVMVIGLSIGAMLAGIAGDYREIPPPPAPALPSPPVVNASLEQWDGRLWLLVDLPEPQGWKIMLEPGAMSRACAGRARADVGLEKPFVPIPCPYLGDGK